MSKGANSPRSASCRAGPTASCDRCSLGLSLSSAAMFVRGASRLTSDAVLHNPKATFWRT